MGGEHWLPVVGYEGLYEVSDRGRVKSVSRVIINRLGYRRPVTERILATTVNVDSGYEQVDLHRDGMRTRFPVHRLVLIAFVGAQPAGCEGCHNDGDSLNNSVENLRWDTHSANMRDTVTHGTHRFAAKAFCPVGHEFSQANTYLYRKGDDVWRGCRTCRRDSTRRYRARKKAEVA